MRGPKPTAGMSRQEYQIQVVDRIVREGGVDKYIAERQAERTNTVPRLMPKPGGGR